jgi:hypothetical protein
MLKSRQQWLATFSKTTNIISMKVQKVKPENKKNGNYLSPDFKVANVTIEQSVLASASATSNSLNDVEMTGDYW